MGQVKWFKNSWSYQFGVDVVELRGDDGVQLVELRRVQLVRVPPLAGNGDRLSCQQIILRCCKNAKIDVIYPFRKFSMSTSTLKSLPVLATQPRDQEVMGSSPALSGVLYFAIKCSNHSTWGPTNKQ